MFESKIQTWWETNFEFDRLRSLKPMTGSLSRNYLYQLNDDFVLKIYFEINARFKKETQALRTLQGTDLAPQIIKSKKKDPILGANSTLMSFVQGCSLLQTYHLYPDHKKSEAMAQLAQTVRAIHERKTAFHMVMPASVLSNETDVLVNKKIVQRHAPAEILNLAEQKARKLNGKVWEGRGVFNHGDLHLGNFMVSGEKMWAIDFENARLDFIWKELRNLITFFLISADAVKHAYPNLESSYFNGSLIPQLFLIKKNYPELFPAEAHEWIQLMMINAVLGKYAHTENDPEKHLHNESANFMFDTMFRQGLLGEFFI